MSVTFPAKEYNAKYDPDKEAALKALKGETADTYAGAYGGYSGLANSQGYSPEEQAAITARGANAVNAQYSGLADQMQRRAATSGNSYGLYSGLAAAGTARGNAGADQARQNVIDFAAEKERRRELGIKGLSGLFGNTLQARTQLDTLRRNQIGEGGATSYNYSGNYGK